MREVFAPAARGPLGVFVGDGESLLLAWDGVREVSGVDGLVRLYHVPRSQVWAGSRGGQAGNVHLHVTRGIAFGRIRRGPREALCGRSGWYERPANEGERVCARCESIAARPGFAEALERRPA